MKKQLFISILVLNGLVVSSGAQATYIDSYAVASDNVPGGGEITSVVDNKEEQAEILSAMSSSATTSMASASSEINLDTGVMRVSAVSTAEWELIEPPPGQPGNGSYLNTSYGTANGAVAFNEIISFTAPSTIDFFDVIISATLDGFFTDEVPDPNNVYYAADNFGTLDFLLQGVGNTTDTIDTSARWIDQQTVNFTDSIAVRINREGSNFRSLDLYGRMSATGSFSVDALFSNTAMLSITLPEGITYTSTSGVFLAHPAFNDPGNPGAPVPEPATILLFGTGLASLARAVHGRKKTS